MSDCGVCIGGNHGFEIDDYDASVVVADMASTCFECGRDIPAGSEYELATGTNSEDGDEVSYGTCLDCMNIANGLACERRVHSTLWEDLEECDEGSGFHNFSEACVAKVATVSAKKYLRERWLKWKGLAA